MPSDPSTQHRGRNRAIRPVPYPSPKAGRDHYGMQPTAALPIAIPPPAATRPTSPRLQLFKSASKYGLFRNIVPPPSQEASNNDGTTAPRGRRVRQMAQELELRVIQGRGQAQPQPTVAPTRLRAPSAPSIDSHSSVPFPAPSHRKNGKQRHVDPAPSTSSTHRRRKDATFGHSDSNSSNKDAVDREDYRDRDDYHDHDYPLVAHLFQDYDCISEAGEHSDNASRDPLLSPRKRNKQSWHHTWSREVRRKLDNVSSAHRSVKSRHVVSDASNYSERKRDQRRYQRHARRPSATQSNTGPLTSWQAIPQTDLPQSHSNTYGATFGQVFGNAGGGKGSLFPSATVKSHTARTLRGTPDMSVYLDRTYGLPGKTPTREAIELQNALYNHLAREDSAGVVDATDDAVERIKHWEAHARRHTLDAVPCTSDSFTRGEVLERTPPRQRRRSESPRVGSDSTRHVDDFLEVYTPGPLYQKTPMYHGPATASRHDATPLPRGVHPPSDSDEDYDEEIVRLPIGKTASGSSRIQRLYPGHEAQRQAHCHPLKLHHPDATVSQAVLAAAVAASATRRDRAERQRKKKDNGTDVSSDGSSSDEDEQQRDLPSEDFPPTPGRHHDDSDSDYEPPTGGVGVGAATATNDEGHYASKVEQAEDGWWYRQDRGQRPTEAPTSRPALYAPEDCSTDDSGDEDVCVPLLSPPRQVLEESIARCQDWMARSPPAAERTLPLFQPGWVTPEPLTEVIGHGSRFEEMWREAQRASEGAHAEELPAPTPEQVSRTAEFPRSVTQESLASSRSPKIQIGDTSYEELWHAISRLIADSVANAGQQPQRSSTSSVAPPAAPSSSTGAHRHDGELSMPSRSRAPYPPVLVERSRQDGDTVHKSVPAPLGHASKSSMAAPQVTRPSTVPALTKCMPPSAGEGDENVPPLAPPVVTVTCEDDVSMEGGSTAGRRGWRGRSTRQSLGSSSVSSLVRKSAHLTLRPMRSDVSMRSASSVGARTRPVRTAL